MITPRATRLLRVVDLRQFRRLVGDLASEGSPLEARDRLIVVPTHAAAAHLRQALEDRMTGTAACLIPEMATRDELILRIAARLADRPPVLSEVARHVLMAAAARRAAESGTEPPFHLRPGLVAEILDFYDSLRRQQRSIGTFQRLMLERLEPDAPIDRGAERLVRQTRFLVAAFGEFERQSATTGAADEHTLRDLVIGQSATRPWTHIIVAVGDRASSPHGLWPCDYDLLTRVPGLARFDLVATEAALVDGMQERLHQWLPGIDDLRMPVDVGDPPPSLLTPVPGGEGDAASQVVHTARDREEELAAFARSVRASARADDATRLDRIALVVRRRLPYVYLARAVLGSAGVPCQMFDTLPLAGEPYAAAVDLVLRCATSKYSRPALVGLLSSPHLLLSANGPLPAAAVRQFDRSLREAGYLGGESALRSLAAGWSDDGAAAGLARAGAVACDVVSELAR